MFETSDTDLTKGLCPQCRGGRLKSWKELTSDEKFVAERLPTIAAAASPSERHGHLFCTRCQFETKPTAEKV